MSPTAKSWAVKKQEYDEKPSNGWRNTFEEKTAARHLNKREGFFAYEDRRRVRMADSGWKNIIVKLPEKPPAFSASDKEEEEEALAMQHSLREKGKFCLACMEYVPNTAKERADCEQCCSVVHIRCLHKIDYNNDDSSSVSSTTMNMNTNVDTNRKDLVPETRTRSEYTLDKLLLSSSTTKHKEDHTSVCQPQSNPQSQSQSYSSRVSDTSKHNSNNSNPDSHLNSNSNLKSSRSVSHRPWTCPDCVGDVDFIKNYKGLRHKLQYRDLLELFAIVKVIYSLLSFLYWATFFSACYYIIYFILFHFIFTSISSFILFNFATCLLLYLILFSLTLPLTLISYYFYFKFLIFLSNPNPNHNLISNFNFNFKYFSSFLL